MTANDLYDWKRHPVTQEVFSALSSRIASYTEELIMQTAFMSQSEMADKAGAIKAMRDVLNITFEDIEEPQEQ